MRKNGAERTKQYLHQAQFFCGSSLLLLSQVFDPDGLSDVVTGPDFTGGFGRRGTALFAGVEPPLVCPIPL